MSRNLWSLEVVRGKSIGKSYPLSGDQFTLGNALNGSTGLDLSGEEGDGPRRMAGRQALIERSNAGLAVRDLDSPGGTFVNRQRILPGQARTLQPGDVIQLGGVQLKLVTNGAPPGASTAAPAPTRTSPGTSTFTYSIAGGTTCHSWDDLLTASAQRWSAVRDELSSGRIDAFLRSISRTDLAPPTAGTADDRLDAWLGLLPTTRAKDPILEVHPRTLTVKVAPGGGQTQRTIGVSNVGYRLLRIKARVEPGADWLKLAGEAARGQVSIAESANLALEITIPEQLKTPLNGTVTIESNGGTQTVTIKLVAAESSGQAIPTGSAPVRPAESPLAGVSMQTRLIFASAGGLIARSLVGLAARFLPGTALVPESVEAPGLFGPVVVLAVLGAVFGAWFGKRRGTGLDFVTGATGFGLLGAFAAAGLVAASRAIEPGLGAVGRNPIGQGIVWALIGATLAGISLWLTPVKQKGTQS